jgi:hypothetical protein
MFIHDTKILRWDPARQQTLLLANTRPTAAQKRMAAVVNPLRSHWAFEDGKLRLAWSLDDKAEEKPGPRRKSLLYRPARVKVCLNVPLTCLWESGNIDAPGPGYCFIQTSNSFGQCAA